MDILSALRNEAPHSATARPCLIQRWLDEIPDETPGKDELAITLRTRDPLDPHYRQLDALDRLLMGLGLATSIKTIGDHRAGRCRCSV